MKLKLITTGIALCFCVLFSNVKAQDLMISAGVDLVMPLGDFGDFASFGAGIAVGAEYGISDNIGLTVQTGYDLLFVDSEIDFIKSMSIIPAQAGLKYYFDEVGSGVYAHGQVGIHSMSITAEDVAGGETESDSNLSFAIGGGIFVNENLDLGLRFNIITSGEDGVDASNYIGVRAGYNF
ncbi:MAG: hypothetical protein ACI9AT_000898 [Ulvibacter sp.]|jgi:hypothetical protein